MRSRARVDSLSRAVRPPPPNRTVHRARPSGGGPHTIATIAACCVLSSSGSGRASRVEDSGQAAPSFPTALG